MGIEFQFGGNEKVLEMDGMIVSQHCECPQCH